MKSKPAWIFIGLAYLFCYAIVFAYFGTGGTLQSGGLTVALIACMFTPAIAAIIVQKYVKHEPLSDLGIKFRFNRWMIFAWLLPVGYVLLTWLFSWLLPQTQGTDGLSVIVSMLEQVSAPADQITEVQTVFGQFGAVTPLILAAGIIMSGLIAGVTVNMLAAMGEELGWRGFLWREWKHWGVWKASLAIGVVWGFWHAPMIWYGYNYPEHPRIGVLMMVGFTVLLSPLHSFVREKAGTTWAAAILHGTNNALGGLVPLFVIGGNDLLVNITGAAGLAALLVANIVVAVLWKGFASEDAAISVDAQLSGFANPETS